MDSPPYRQKAYYSNCVFADLTRGGADHLFAHQGDVSAHVFNSRVIHTNTIYRVFFPTAFECIVWDEYCCSTHSSVLSFYFITDF